MSALAVKDDAKVGRELAQPLGWLIRRTKRVEELLAVPEVMALAQELVTYLDNYCAIRELDPTALDVEVVPTPTLRYITLKLDAE